MNIFLVTKKYRLNMSKPVCLKKPIDSKYLNRSHKLFYYFSHYLATFQDRDS